MNTRPLLQLLLAVLLLASSGSGQESVVRWSAFDMGFGLVRSGNTVVLAAVGQPLVGQSQAGGTKIISGFLSDSLFGQAVVSVDEDAEGVPAAFALDQNYPNPFNPTTTISYSVPRQSHVKLVVYSILGQELAVLVNEEQQPGYYRARFDAGSLATGTYIYRIQAGDFVQSRKLLLVK
jgi:hypothetical protein